MNTDTKECEHSYYQSQEHYGNWKCVHCDQLISRSDHTNILFIKISDLERKLAATEKVLDSLKENK